MECMATKALKSSFFSELPMKTGSFKDYSDDLWCVTGLTTGSGGDDFSIDEFFDLPNEDAFKNTCFLTQQEEEEEEKYSSHSQDPVDETISISPNFSPDLAIPVDDLQELELWSHFMDDSVPEATFACPNPINDNQPKKTGFNSVNRSEPSRKRSAGRVPFIPSAVPVKPRTKRPKTTVNRNWFTRSPASSTSSSSSSSSSPVSTLTFPNPVHEIGIFFTFGKPAVKKSKKKQVPVGGETAGSVVQRRCTHCQVTKTPQWRAGPTGPKTLCNACGVRFKSGRLFPEYRPACSPTFSSDVHSNSHRKVLEMRRKKDMTGSVTGLNPTVSSS